MEEQRENKPVYCANGCGFFGNPGTENCCSKCFKDRQLAQKKSQENQMDIIPPVMQEAKKDEIQIEQAKAPTIPEQKSEVQSTTEEKKEEEKPDPNVQKDTTRCWKCRGKVGLLGFRCRCEYVFCSKHRHADQHACPYDYKAAHKQKLEAQNPQIIAAKINKV
eukprot:TRINITY_DN382_c0_g1_i1.p1 TRINITY_DN382_c0_g1~~TRINITY_DN382_c0_g1_i1.p1  ORF type:complete len:163 (-),score=23.52 TRINITY_DN382_c0_g1_i1:115-603(-)